MHEHPPFLTDEFLQFSFSDEGLNLLFQIVAIRSIVTVIAVETAILVSGSLGWIALQLPWERQRSLVFDLHQHLV